MVPTFQPFHFYANKEVDYHVPEYGAKESYTNVIAELPMMQVRSESTNTMALGGLIDLLERGSKRGKGYFTGDG